MTQPILPDRRMILGILGASAFSAGMSGRAPEAYSMTPQGGEYGDVILHAYRSDGALLDFAARATVPVRAAMTTCS